jgi:hypothetical protein
MPRVSHFFAVTDISICARGKASLETATVARAGRILIAHSRLLQDQSDRIQDILDLVVETIRNLSCLQVGTHLSRDVERPVDQNAGTEKRPGRPLLGREFNRNNDFLLGGFGG